METTMSRLLMIDTDNDAFQDNGWQREAARTLLELRRDWTPIATAT